MAEQTSLSRPKIDLQRFINQPKRASIQVKPFEIDEIRKLEVELEQLEQEEEKIKVLEQELKVSQESRPRGTSAPEFSGAGSSQVKVAQRLKEFINDEEFSDIILSAEGKEIFCHKVILAQFPYFNQYFRSNKAVKVLKMKERYPVVRAMIEFIYTGITSIEMEYAEELYVVALVYELEDLVNFLREQMDNSKFLSLSDSVKKMDLTSRNSVSLFETARVRSVRKKIATEIVQSERTYVESIGIVIKEVVEPIKAQDSGSKNPTLTGDIFTVFNYFELITNCHLRLLEVFENRIKNWDSHPEMGDIFVEKTAFIKLYKHYINNFDSSIVAFARLKQDSQFSKFIAEWEKKKGILDSFLILPVQRIPRYVLLLQDLLKNTVKGHKDYKNLKLAVKTMKELMDYLNANKSDADEIKKVLAVEDRVSQFPSPEFTLVQPRRRFIKEGKLSRNDKEVIVFIFTDAILYCTPKKKDKVKYQGIIQLATASLTIDGLANNQFAIMSPSGKHVFTCQDVVDRASWMTHISKVIESSRQDLMNSAFSPVSGTGKFFQQAQEEDRMRKRSETATRILNMEKQYVGTLELIFKVFMVPVQESIAQNYPIISKKELQTIFCGVDKIYNIHLSFLKDIEERVKTWDPERTCLGDLFVALLGNIVSHYEKYLQNYASSLETIEECGRNSSNWLAFQVMKETEHKVSLPLLLEMPLKRISQYYLQLEELNQYTPPSHNDKEQIRVALERTKLQLEQQKKMGTSSSIKRTGLRKIQTLESIFFDPKQGQAKTSSSPVNLTRKRSTTSIS